MHTFEQGKYGRGKNGFFLLLRRKMLSENICKVNFAQYGSIKYIVAPVLSPKLPAKTKAFFLSFQIFSWLLELPRVITGWERQCRFLARLCLKWHCYNYCVSPGVSAVAINCRPQTRQFKHVDDVLLPFCLFVLLLRKRHHGINVGARHAAANYGMRSGEKSNAIIFILMPW